MDVGPLERFGARRLEAGKTALLSAAAWADLRLERGPGGGEGKSGKEGAAAHRRTP